MWTRRKHDIKKYKTRGCMHTPFTRVVRFDTNSTLSVFFECVLNDPRSRNSEFSGCCCWTTSSTKTFKKKHPRRPWAVCIIMASSALAQKTSSFYYYFSSKSSNFVYFPPFFFAVCWFSRRGLRWRGEKRKRRKTLKEGLDGEGMWLHL
jgi:hypothetical protein